MPNSDSWSAEFDRIKTDYEQTAGIDKVYLGDSVYAESHGASVLLTTENGLPSDPSNQIFIEPEVWKALLRFMERNN